MTLPLNLRGLLVLVGLVLGGLVLGVACSKDAPAPNGEKPKAPAGTAPEASALPPLLLKDDSADLLLTWIDAQGDFHVVQKPADVPEASRDKVRVVVATQEAGTGRLVYVADLRSKNADGSYVVKSMSRSEWNELGADRRKVRLEALAPTATPEGAGGAPDLAANGKVRAVIYGADWCKPCHSAEDLLKSLGVDVTMKDIEESNAARAEMQQKLAKAGRSGASIPVIDVAGQVLVGFSAQALRQAVRRAAKSETL